MEEIKRLTLCDGKYTWVIHEESVKCFRYGEEWRDFCGDGAVRSLFIYACELTGRVNQLERMMGKISMVLREDIVNG